MATIVQTSTAAAGDRLSGTDFKVAERHESKVFPDGSSLVRVEQVPWTPWAMEGSEFKLLYINRAHGMFTRADPHGAGAGNA